MDIKIKLGTLVSYYEHTRRAGHTTLMKEGINNYQGDKILVAYKLEQGKIILDRKTDDVKIVSVNNIESLIGDNKPITFDNYALQTIFEEAYNEISRLRDEVSSLKLK